MISFQHFLNPLNEEYLIPSIRWKKESIIKKQTKEEAKREREERHEKKVVEEFKNAYGLDLLKEENKELLEKNKETIREQIKKRVKKEEDEESERIGKEINLFHEKNQQICISTWNVGSLDLTPLLRAGSCSCTVQHCIKQLELSYVFVDRYPSNFLSCLNSHYSKLHCNLMNKLKAIAEQIVELNPDILFLQEIRNSCSLKVLCSYLNYFISWKLGEYKEYYKCMIDKEDCREGESISYNEAEKRSSVIDINNSGIKKGQHVKHKEFKDLKGALVREEKIRSCRMFVPVNEDKETHYHSSNEENNNESVEEDLFLDNNNKNKNNNSFIKDEFSLCDCFFAMEFSCPLLDDSSPSFVDQSDFEGLQSQNCYSMSKLTISSFRRKKEIRVLALVVHLRSLKNPENVFIRDRQVEQMKNWVKKKLVKRVNPTHLMIAGDMNDYEVEDKDINDNSPKIQICGKAAILEQLKCFFADVPLAIAEHDKALLINTCSLRSKNTRFTNSYIYDLSNPHLFYGSICHILVSQNFPTLLFKRTASTYLSRIHGFKLLPLSTYNLNRYSISEFIKNIVNNNELMNLLKPKERETVLMYCSMNQFKMMDLEEENESREKIMERAETIKTRKTIFDRTKRMYIKYLYKEIEKTETNFSLDKMPNGTFASDHVPVYFRF